MGGQSSTSPQGGLSSLFAGNQAAPQVNVPTISAPQAQSLPSLGSMVPAPSVQPGSNLPPQGQPNPLAMVFEQAGLTPPPYTGKGVPDQFNTGTAVNYGSSGQGMLPGKIAQPAQATPPRVYQPTQNQLLAQALNKRASGQ